MALETVSTKGDGNCLTWLQNEHVGAAVAAAGDSDLGFAAAGDGHCADIAGCQVRQVDGQD